MGNKKKEKKRAIKDKRKTIVDFDDELNVITEMRKKDKYKLMGTQFLELGKNIGGTAKTSMNILEKITEYPNVSLGVLGSIGVLSKIYL